LEDRLAELQAEALTRPVTSPVPSGEERIAGRRAINNPQPPVPVVEREQTTASDGMTDSERQVVGAIRAAMRDVDTDADAPSLRSSSNTRANGSSSGEATPSVEAVATLAQEDQEEEEFNAFLAALSGASDDPRVSARVQEMLDMLRRMSPANGTQPSTGQRRDEDGGEGRSKVEEEEEEAPELPTFLRALGLGLRANQEVEIIEAAEDAAQEARLDGVVIPAIPPLLAATSLLRDEADLGDTLDPINQDVLDLIRAISDPNPQPRQPPQPVRQQQVSSFAGGRASNQQQLPVGRQQPRFVPTRGNMIANRQAQPQMMGGSPTFDNIPGLMGLGAVRNGGIDGLIANIPGLVGP
jgi:hypothetical protein